MRRLIDPTSCAAPALRAHKVADEINAAGMVVALAGATPPLAFR